ncbi:carbohydrate kinase family protein [Cohnella phaseoli]|uniref:Sugar/nucleoside kinase (Ribokinase family) n=1 Tax=Cohnella phaseoli TaxID=456490 RepID=A0A3D9KCF2_9BACL|nr:carbohydrate kinase family protein [Cohnella phaseoli]RED84214.1 sugar/nucleoside kinase (ribokinase family) [Cohnella phaseoli]
MSKVVYIVGELNPDAILSGPDVKPEPNKEKLIEHFELTLGSSSAITACVLARLGVEVRFVSIAGNDEYGRFCIEQLKQYGVNTDYVAITDREKTGVTFSLSNPTDRSLLTYMGTIPLVEPSLIPLTEIAREADHLHFGSFFLQEGMKPHWQEVFRQVRQAGVTTSFDTGYDPHERWDREIIASLLAHTDYFIPSETEAEHIFGSSDPEELANALPEKRGFVALKRGGEGASLLPSSGAWIHAEAYRVSPIDTTGAGDSFNAGFLYARLHKASAEECLRFASACGAMATLRIGGVKGAPTADEVLQFIAGRR